MTRTGMQILESLHDIEAEPKKLVLTETHEIILAWLEQQEDPKLCNTIAKALDLNLNSCRARMSELVKLGKVYQPLKNLKIGELGEDGQPLLSGNYKRGYLIKA